MDFHWRTRLSLETVNDDKQPSSAAYHGMFKVVHVVLIIFGLIAVVILLSLLTCWIYKEPITEDPMDFHEALG